MKIEFSFSEERNAFVLDHQHGRRDVTCKPAITSSFPWPHGKVSVIVSTPFRYLTLHLRDRHGAVSLCCRNRAIKSSFSCVKSPIRYGFRTGGKAIPYSANIALGNF